MAKNPETKFLERIRPLIAGLPLTHVLKIQQVALRGAPDLIAVINGWSVWMELKRDGKQKAKPIQLYHLRRAATAGAIAMVVHPGNWPKVYDVLQAISDGTFVREDLPECLKLPTAI